MPTRSARCAGDAAGRAAGRRARASSTAALRAKCRVIFQSAPTLAAVAQAGAASARVHGRPPARREGSAHLHARGAAPARTARPALRAHRRRARSRARSGRARAPQPRRPRYRWRGALPRAATRQRIRRAHLLVNSSRMEGGAQVILEAAQQRHAGARLAHPRQRRHARRRPCGLVRGRRRCGSGARCVERAARRAGVPEPRCSARDPGARPAFAPAEEARRAAHTWCNQPSHRDSP